jgi:hypothetical protein
MHRHCATFHQYLLPNQNWSLLALPESSQQCLSVPVSRSVSPVLRCIHTIPQTTTEVLPTEVLHTQVPAVTSCDTSDGCTNQLPKYTHSTEYSVCFYSLQLMLYCSEPTDGLPSIYTRHSVCCTRLAANQHLQGCADQCSSCSLFTKPHTDCSVWSVNQSYGTTPFPVLPAAATSLHALPPLHLRHRLTINTW